MEAANPLGLAAFVFAQFVYREWEASGHGWEELEECQTLTLLTLHYSGLPLSKE
jgi:hypothetical protein